jgi:hypothetical protein
MFCLGEESIADHLGERKPREDLDALEEQANEENNSEDMPPLELVKARSEVS